MIPPSCYSNTAGRPPSSNGEVNGFAYLIPPTRLLGSLCSVDPFQDFENYPVRDVSRSQPPMERCENTPARSEALYSWIVGLLPSSICMSCARSGRAPRRGRPCPPCETDRLMRWLPKRTPRSPSIPGGVFVRSSKFPTRLTLEARKETGIVGI